MNLALLLVGTALAAVIVIHMLSPRFKPLQLSAARLLAGIPPAASRRLSLQLIPPFRSLAFWLQSLAALLLLLAVLLAILPRTLLPTQRVGLRLFVDSSLSMRLPDAEGADRLTRALDAVGPTLQRLDREASGALGGGFCAELIAFDTEVAEPQRFSSATALIRAAEVLPRGIDGTDLRTVLARLPASETAGGAEAGGCPITHRIVLTDRPAPALPADVPADRVAWLDLGTPSPDIHVGRIRTVGAGAARRLAVEVGTAGLPGGAATVLLQDGEGDELARATLDAAAPLQTAMLPAAAGGTMTVTLEAAADALAEGNRSQVVLPGDGATPMLWPAAEPSFAARMGWAPQDAATPEAPAPQFGLGQLTEDGTTLDTAAAADLPRLLLPVGYGRDMARRQLGTFQPDHPLLNGVNLSALQGAQLAVGGLAEGYSPILLATDGRVLVATAQRPPRLLLPALPRFDDSAPDRALLLLLLNGLDWLHAQGKTGLDQRWLTEDGRALPDVAQELAAREDEPRSAGDLDTLHAVAETEDRMQAWWPLLAAAALALMTADRIRAGRQRVLA